MNLSDDSVARLEAALPAVRSWIERTLEAHRNDALPVAELGFLRLPQYFRRRSESLCFHELVHVIQWEQLGVDRFLLAYGLGLLRHGYEKMPLERMAYALQEQFDAGVVIEDLVTRVRSATREVWRRTDGVQGVRPFKIADRG